MSNEIETQIEDEIFRDKLKNFYKKYRILILIISLILFTTPVIFQINIHYKNSKNAELTAKYLEAEMLLKNGNVKHSIEILNILKLSNNDAIKSLSISRLVKYYLEIEDMEKALEMINDSNIRYDSKIFEELKNIKEALLKFDTIKEGDLINLLKINNSEFKNIKLKILKDFYIKNNQFKKAKEIK